MTEEDWNGRIGFDIPRLDHLKTNCFVNNVHGHIADSCVDGFCL